MSQEGGSDINIAVRNGRLGEYQLLSIDQKVFDFIVHAVYHYTYGQAGRHP
jgi:hypothetical protein